MLEIAQKYKEELQKKMLDIWFKDKYKYWNADVYFSEFKVSEDSWDTHQFVSVYSGRVIGYIGYDINRRTNNIDNLNAIHFDDDNESNNTFFGVTLMNVIKNIFEVFHFNKLNFSVLIGNPVEKSYDRLIEEFGGRIVGYREKHCKLYDGTYCDEKLYEITSEQYFANKKNRKE